LKNKAIPFNLPQLTFALLKPAEAKNIWSRGTGKSFIIAWLIHIIVKNMPRSMWAIVGKSYKQLLTRTLPGTISTLEGVFGYREGVDFLIRKRPTSKDGFAQPMERTLDYDHCIIFKNGCFFHLVSLDGGGSTIRGLNIDGYLGDEALEINQQKLESEVVPTNRGNLRHYGHIPWHHGSFFFSSMGYGPEFKWMRDAGDYYIKDGFNFRAVREEIVKLELQLIDEAKDPEEIAQLWEQLKKQKEKLRWYKSKTGLLYMEADIFDNIQNVGWKYIKQLRRSMIDFLFMVEVLNWLPDAIEFGFYASLNRKDHGYSNRFNIEFIGGEEYNSEALKNPDCRMDSDLIAGQPLRLSADWGSKINSLTVCQYLKSINTLRFLKNLYVKGEILDKLAADFCEYYKHHHPKRVLFTYGHDGNTSLANSKLTYAQQFAKILEKNAWEVQMSTDRVPLTQMERMLLWNKVLKNTTDAKAGRAVDPAYPLVEFNLDNCNETFVSMQNAPVKEGRNGLEKNKDSERNASIPQEEATHLSDTADYQLTAVINNPFNHMPGYIGH
jgi:hypothetical protein